MKIFKTSSLDDLGWHGGNQEWEKPPLWMEQRKKRLHSVLDPKCCLVHLQKKFQQLLNWNYLLMRKARFTKVSKCRWHVSKGRDLEKRISFHNTRKDNVLKPSNLQKQTLKQKGKWICDTAMLKMILIFSLPIPQCAVWAVWVPRKQHIVHCNERLLNLFIHGNHFQISRTILTKAH